MIKEERRLPGRSHKLAGLLDVRGLEVRKCLKDGVGPVTVLEVILHC